LALAVVWDGAVPYQEPHACCGRFALLKFI
jgi:hypothetical protein